MTAYRARLVLVAWLLAPDHPRAATPLAAAPDVEPMPLLEAA